MLQDDITYSGAAPAQRAGAGLGRFRVRKIQGLGVQGFRVLGFRLQGLEIQGLGVQGFRFLGFRLSGFRQPGAAAQSSGWLGQAEVSFTLFAMFRGSGLQVVQGFQGLGFQGFRVQGFRVAWPRLGQGPGPVRLSACPVRLPASLPGSRGSDSGRCCRFLILRGGISRPKGDFPEMFDSETLRLRPPCLPACPPARLPTCPPAHPTCMHACMRVKPTQPTPTHRHRHTPICCWSGQVWERAKGQTQVLEAEPRCVYLSLSLSISLSLSVYIYIYIYIYMITVPVISSAARCQPRSLQVSS